MLNLKLTNAVIAGFVFFFLNEYFALGTFGRIVSFGLTALLLVLAISSSTRALFGFLIVGSLSARENRQLSTVYDIDNVIFDTQYFTFFTTEFFGFNLYIWTLLIMGVISFVRITLLGRKISLGKSSSLLLAFSFLVVMFLAATLLDLPLRQDTGYKYIISDIRPLLVFLLGIIITIDVKNENSAKGLARNFISLLKFLAGGLGTLFILTLINDLYQGELRLLFNTSPHIMWPLFFTCIFCSKHLGARYGALSFAAAFKIARGEMLNIGLSIIMAMVYFGKLQTNLSFTKNMHVFRSVTVLFIIIGGILAFMSTYYSYIFKFIIFKFSFFNDFLYGQVSSSSVSMRIVELKNILAHQLDNLGALFWGRGLGGYFTFVEFAAPRSIERHDFSLDQISSGFFYKPHHFSNFLLLKGGIIGLCSYILFCFRFIRLGLEIIKLGSDDDRILGVYIFFFSIYCLNMFWQPILIVWALLVYAVGELSLRNIKNGYRYS